MGWPYCTKSTHQNQRRPPNNGYGRPFDSIFAQSGVAHSGGQMHHEFVTYDHMQVCLSVCGCIIVYSHGVFYSSNLFALTNDH